MTKTLVSRFHRTFAALAAAARAANAVEAGGNPRGRDLDALGIDRTDFRNINR